MTYIKWCRKRLRRIKYLPSEVVYVGSSASGISITSASSTSLLPLLVFLRFEVVLYSKLASVCWMFFFLFEVLACRFGCTDHPVCFGQVGLSYRLLVRRSRMVLFPLISTIHVEVPQIFTDLEDYSWYVEKYYNILTHLSSLNSSNHLFIAANPSSTFFC